MSTLTPDQAAAIARGVYALRDQSVAEAVDRGEELGIKDLFAINDGSRFAGTSGGLIMCKKISGFGFIAEGEGTRRGEVLIATRGTAVGYDWLTNLNIGVQIGPGGQLVHAGFNQAWRSFRHEISTFMRGRNPSVIHCVGHSLGGALATLNADYLSTARAGEVKLYTFGSPRTGDMIFSRSLSRRVTPGNIHRVHHRADPVPMIPLFPFSHVPAGTPGCELIGAPSGLISIDAHSMETSYIPGVDGRAWSELAVRREPRRNEVEAWLEQASSGGGYILKGSAYVLRMINRALVWILDQIAGMAAAAGAVLGAGLTMQMTVLDRLAWFLSTGARLTVELARYIRMTIAAIFRYLGRKVDEGVSMTRNFIRWVLELLYDSLAIVARRALARLR